ncbi:MAG: diacylglycerol/lipid kinase family protein [Bacteroidota bacterium]
MKLVFIVKSTIRNKKKFWEDYELFQRKNVVEFTEVWESEYFRHSISLAEKATLEGYDYIIAVGGDGTLNEVLNGIMLASIKVRELPQLGMLPYGSANDFSKTIGITPDISLLVEAIEKDHSTLIDIGKIELTDEDGQPVTRYFINVFDAGIGADVVRKVNASNKPLGTRFTFIKAILGSLLTYTPTPLVCKTDHEIIEDRMLSFVIANGSFFGDGMCIAPDARVNDGSFSVVAVADISVKDYILNTRKLRKKMKIDHPKVSYHKAHIVEIFPKHYSCSIETDGEFAGYAPAKTSMMHHAIRFTGTLTQGVQ